MIQPKNQVIHHNAVVSELILKANDNELISPTLKQSKEILIKQIYSTQE